MKISLFLQDKIHEFVLTKKILGSFSFDIDANEENKLINVDAKSGRWILYSTDDVKIIDNNFIIDEIELQSDTFYTLVRNNQKYLIYVSNVDFFQVDTYSYDSKVNLIIGNTVQSNLKYNCKYLSEKNIKISFIQNELVVDNSEEIAIYVDKKNITSKKFYLSFGSEVYIYGLCIIFLKNIILIKKNKNLLIDFSTTGLSAFKFTQLEKPENINVKDIDLYKQEDFFSKSPRMKRIIETKEIALAEPPDVMETNMPLILTLGPMFTMGIISVINFVSIITRIKTGQATFSEVKMELLTQGLMLTSTLVWPLIINLYNKISTKIRKKRARKKYLKYLSQKRIKLEEEKNLQKSILMENLLPIENCAKIALGKKMNFWDRRLDQNDLLEVRVGNGSESLDIKIQYPKKEFSLNESDLDLEAEKLIQDYKYIENAPIKYSFSKNKITAVMGDNVLCRKFISNTLLQLMTYYSYEDLKIITFTNSNNKDIWDYLKYFNHSFSNERDIRFFASNSEQAKKICERLNVELSDRIEKSKDKKVFSPYYFIVVDDYNMIKRFDFIKRVTEISENLGFSMLILENKMSKLPSKCNNFISLSPTGSSILCNAFEKQQIKKFNFELDNYIDMYEIARSLSNVPIEFSEGIKILPDTITFLEMEKVGKVEQLNILNRWEKNDATQSLRTEIGVDEQGDYIFLDLHEKFHGPHGLIAGTTGSGKSEFIITYILSLAINYSPDDVSFVLIDYKGGGLAFAFENKLTGISLPHLAGTITNLDKAEMNRTLISIDSEIKRRQQIFNEARDKCGESTIDIYKYQRLYKDGVLKEPVPHLFIICDEFAELKAQQPEFMENLISVARIGRSLGIHLILATQKPSGVVDDQIWSNTKFRVCLKVQDENDSREMLKRPEAAELTQAGRFYLQVGTNEIFSLGQSAWCGAKYFPSDKIVKQIDKNISFIDESGTIFKNVQNTNEKLVSEAKGEQLSVIMNNIIESSKQTNKKSKKLWLDNIPNVILADEIYNKYNYNRDNNLFDIILGEYDAPEYQKQGVETYNLLKDGNLILYGSEGSEKEFFLSSFMYSSTIFHTPEEINIYLIDYGSESLRVYKKLPHLGDMVFSGDKEKYKNLIKLIKDEITERKRLFSDYGGQYSNYIANSGNKLPIKIFIINNFETLYEEDPEAYDLYPELLRDSERYGIIFIFTSSAYGSIPSKISQNFAKQIAFKMKDSSDYFSIFDMKNNVALKDTIGRGVVKHNALHEFQTLSIVSEETELNNFIISYIKSQNEKYDVRAPKIPKLPEIVTIKDVKGYINNLDSVPLGIYKKGLEVAGYDLVSNIGNIITGNKITSLENFSYSMIQLLFMNNANVLILDGMKKLKIFKNNKINYYDENFDMIIEKLTRYVEQLSTLEKIPPTAIVIFGISKMLSKMEETYKLDELVSALKKLERVPIIIIEEAKKVKDFSYESWFSMAFDSSEGIWIGSGMSDQSVFSISSYDKELQAEIPNNMGYIITGSIPKLIKFVELKQNKEKNADEK